MARFLTWILSLTAVLAATSFIALPPGSNDDVAASDLELIWGNWLCYATEPQEPSNALGVLEYIAELEYPLSACPLLGDVVNHAEHGQLFWGDADCDDEIDEIDALLLLLWYEDLAEEIADCPVLGDVFEEAAAPQAEWEADESAFETLGPYNANLSGSVHSQGVVALNNHPTLVREDFYAHNSGPAESQAVVTFEAAVIQGNVFIRWISQSQCTTPEDENIPCGEANNGQQTDTCLDGSDNDSDSATDLDDTDCVEVRKMAQGALQAPNTGGSVYDRYLTITCLEGGDVQIEFRNQVFPLPPAEDPDPNNNESSVTLTGTCSVTKGPPFAGSSPEAPRPYTGPGPYLPAALPQSGGPPEPQ